MIQGSHIAQGTHGQRRGVDCAAYSRTANRFHTTKDKAFFLFPNPDKKKYQARQKGEEIWHDINMNLVTLFHDYVRLCLVTRPTYSALR